MEESKTIAVTGVETALGSAVVSHLEGLGHKVMGVEGPGLPVGFESADALVCCHGTNEALDWLECPADQWRAMRELNLDSMFRGLQAYANARVAAEAQGVVILTAHDGSNGGDAADVLWSAASWGVRGIVRNAAAAYARKGVRVNAVCVGDQGVSPADVATLVAFLMGQAHITGQTIPVAGGRQLL